jgi:hypothetical protein
MWMPIYNLFVAVLGLHLKLSNTQSHCKGFGEKTTTSQKNKKSELVNVPPLAPYPIHQT